jgi:hypothetical protein
MSINKMIVSGGRITKDEEVSNSGRNLIFLTVEVSLEFVDSSGTFDYTRKEFGP